MDSFWNDISYFLFAVKKNQTGNWGLEIPPTKTNLRTLMLYEVSESDRLPAVQAIR